MLRKFTIAGLAILLHGCITAPPTIDQLEARGYTPLEVEEVFVAEGTMKQLAERGAVCASQTLRFDPFQIGDAGSSAGLFGGGVGKQVIPGGEILVSKDTENGVIVANSRTPANFMILRLMVQSTVTIDAKDAKYRIKHTNVQVAASESGSSANTGFQPVLNENGSAKNVRTALAALSKRLSNCMASSAGNKDF